MEKVYIAMLVLRIKITNEEYLYYTLGPMIGTLSNGIFTNALSNKKYFKMTNRIMRITKSNLAYYNLIELEDYKSRFPNDKNLNKLVNLYIEYYKDTKYYLYLDKVKGHIVIPIK